MLTLYLFLFSAMALITINPRNNILYHREYQERESVEIRIEPSGVAILSYAAPDYSICINTKNPIAQIKVSLKVDLKIN